MSKDGIVIRLQVIPQKRKNLLWNCFRNSTD